MTKCITCDFNFTPKAGATGSSLKFCGSCRKSHYDSLPKSICVDCDKEYPDYGSKRTRCYDCNHKFLSENSAPCGNCGKSFLAVKPDGTPKVYCYDCTIDSCLDCGQTFRSRQDDGRTYNKCQTCYKADFKKCDECDNRTRKNFALCSECFAERRKSIPPPTQPRERGDYGGGRGGGDRSERSYGTSSRPPPRDVNGDERPLRACKNTSCGADTYYTYCSNCNRQNKILNDEFMVSTCSVCRRRSQGDFKVCNGCRGDDA